MRYLIPLALFIVLIVFLTIGLYSRDPGDPGRLPSALLNKPAPAFRLPQLNDPDKTFSAEEMRGKVWMLNVWASWCVECRYEHRGFFKIAKTVPVYGLNYRDRPEDARSWLGELGDPYVLSVSDVEGRVGMDYGVYGAPETYLIDKGGTIRHRHVGILTEEIWSKDFLPLIQELNRQ